jgi:hypothetical protein
MVRVCRVQLKFEGEFVFHKLLRIQRLIRTFSQFG